MKRISFFTLAILAAFLTAACGSGSGSSPASGAAQITLTAGTYSPSSGPEGIAMEYFKSYIEEKSKNGLKLELYHNNQLGNTNAQIEGVKMGSQDIFLLGIDPLSQWAPEIKYCSVSYLFRDGAHLVKFLQSDIFAPGIKTLEENNIMMLDDKWTFEQGPFRVLVSQKPINSFSDLKGVRMRVPEVETLQKTWAAFGCAPITVSFGEVYLALEQGMIDALEVAHSVVLENSYCEVAKYVIKVDTFPQRTALIMGKKKFDSFPAETQKLLREAAYAAGAVYTQKVKDNFEADKKHLTETLGVKYKEDIDLAPFRKAMEGQYAAWEKSGYFEPGIVERIRKL